MTKSIIVFRKFFSFEVVKLETNYGIQKFERHKTPTDPQTDPHTTGQTDITYGLLVPVLFAP